MSSNAANGLLQPGAAEFEEKEVLPGVFLTDFRPTQQQLAVELEFPRVARLEGNDFVEEEDFDAEPIGIKEKQIAPGVYMTDFRDRNPIGQQNRTTSYGATVYSDASQYEHPEIAEARVQELLNSITHLERSNKELAEFKETDPDPLWQETIDENIVVIAKQKAEINQILTIVKEHALKHAK